MKLEFSKRNNKIELIKQLISELDDLYSDLVYYKDDVDLTTVHTYKITLRENTITDLTNEKHLSNN